jgi:hypothetical protein
MTELVQVVCKIEERSVIQAATIKEFSPELVCAVNAVLRYDLSPSAALFGTTFKQISNNLRLVSALSPTGGETKLEMSWKAAVCYIDTILLYPEHQNDDVVLFRMKMIEDVDTTLALYITLLMHNSFFPILGPDVKSVFFGNAGWLEFKREWIIEQRNNNMTAICDPISHQLKTMHALLSKLNHMCGTHWHCKSRSFGPKATEDVIAKRHTYAEQRIQKRLKIQDSPFVDFSEEESSLCEKGK